MILWTACAPEEQVTFTGPVGSATYLPLPDANLAEGPKNLLGTVGSSIGDAEYLIGDETRVFVFEGDITNGVTAGFFVQLPQSFPATTRFEVMPGLVPYQSFRIYDQGRCSTRLNWSVLAPQVIQLVQGVLSGLSDDRVLDSTPRYGSMFRARLQGNGVRDEDVLMFDVEAHALRFGPVGFSCDQGDYQVSLGFSLLTRDGRIAPPGVDPLNDAPSGTDPYDLEVPVPSSEGAVDIRGVVQRAEVDLYGLCGNELVLTGGLEGGLALLVPYIVTEAIRGILLVDPRTIGIPPRYIRACTADTDCNLYAPGGPAYGGGARHRCHIPSGATAGECWYQLEPERVHGRPVGLEIVLAEDESDPQFTFVNQSTGLPIVQACLPTRYGIGPDNDAANRSLVLEWGPY